MKIIHSHRPALLFLLLSFSILSSCKENKQAASGPPPPPPAIKVTVEPVQYARASYFDEYPATVNPLNQVDLRPQVSGFITGVHFKDGDRVRKGQLLYSIDNQLYAANYQQAVANLEVQQANLNKVQKDADRYHELAQNDAIARQVVDNADAALEVSKKQIEAAKANIQALQTNVNYTKVLAPFDGVIGISSVKSGTAVTAGQSMLNTVSSDQEMAVDFNIDQKEIYRFAKLLQDKTKIVDSVFTLAFGEEVYPYPGHINLLDRAVNPQTGTLKARLTFPNPKKLLIAGMNGTVRVKNNHTENSILIPNKAITEQLGEYFVYIPNDSNKVTQRKIIPGRQIGKDIIILNGLNPEDRVVVEGVQNLREGAAITTTLPKPPAADTMTRK
ncbi:MAG: efflux RND transporter periplasmic adaptor subunit [Saprospiraceae bacterium]|nr:efflux RND transporter periplasmic adaptor subunit [Saprospiraceae bacterium]MBK7605860.1 efflux RND transporter periplasmic adaptor subunit [Saprospiraceae bacterium]MBK8513544.1 efflux RND transporter periplasmic adaptor subunit [Saprospiraceae bacterium]MBL0110248.1 efflux RND transporter periplasmic adaptor subunit [Saprospiraceae bacterium]MBP7802508.1 efflux RND transporter periplasmic adaptor subunit [Saprospiraceae bacterium]